ncbi:MAG: NAD+ synthase [Candidatus Thorarchaeota archaeon]|nr:NAD+ synthase [Candidatus Thorarchaeota archaeon]
MRIALGQLNATVGDIDGNVARVVNGIRQARQLGADIVAFPEMVVTGYPPQDLLYERDFVRANRHALEVIGRESTGITAVVGFVDHDEKWKLFNAAAVLGEGRVLSVIHKTLLPTYDVFDEARYFTSARPEDIRPVLVMTRSGEVPLGIEICEDLWDDSYDVKVTDILKSRGAQLILNLSASPFHVGKALERSRVVTSKATRSKLPVLLVNLVGGQDELVFDGHSMASDPDGNVIAYARGFEEDMMVVDLMEGRGPAIPLPEQDRAKETFDALVLGLRDYFRKTGFKMAVLGLSGGIDSAVTACIAAEALGPENVVGFSMPSRFSSEHSKTDAELLADNLGIHYLQFSIQDIVDSYHESLSSTWQRLRESLDIHPDEEDPVADENIQPRVRGNCLMDFSNRFRGLKMLVLNTGNKTELALGYCTLYGDMTGGVGVIGDVSKKQVYELAHYINQRKGRDVIPIGSITKRPSAELRPDQFDPFDFDIVSPLVDEIIEKRTGRRELIEMGYPPEVVDDVYSRIRRAEYKRWQAPPCIRVTRRAFGTGWKMPIVNLYRG